ncbi:MAG: N-acetylmuramoyl-L-alanine amidase [Acidobacteriota bacterium]|nr:N-acetylmuramoyl-L-alanine amidase [Acidobacteriota bacterium]
MRLRLISLALSLVAPLSSQTATQALQITDVRFWSLSGVTRVAIETTGPFTFKSDRIPNPERLFFDIEDAKPRTAARRIQIKPVNDKLLKRIRIAENVPGVTRIVLDLEDNVEYSASQLFNPDRLIVELRPGAGIAPGTVSFLAPVPMPNPPVAAPALTAKLPAALSNPATPVENPQVAADLGSPPALSLKPSPSVPPALAAIEPGTPSPSRKMSSDGGRSLVRALGLKINRIVIDPGHGGHDQGTAGTNGLLEKDLVLDVALRLRKLIEQKMGIEAILTRHDDTYIGLRERTALANQKKADLFLSIHANSSPALRVSGIETYYLNFSSSTESLDVAARENASAQNSVYDLKDLVQSIAQHDKIEESREFAQSIQSSLQAFESRNSSTAKDRGIRKAPFVVLIGAQMPSVLAEIGFLSNSHEETLLSRPEHRQKLAEALYRGLSKYTQNLSHFEITKMH